MFIDAQCQLSSAQAITVDAVSTNAYDLGAVPTGTANGAAPDPSIGEPMGIVVAVTVAADSTTADETYAFEAIQSTVTALTSPDVLVRVPFTAAQAAAGALAAGTIVVIPLPSGSVTKRFIGLNYDVGGTTPTITCSAWVAPLSMIQKQRFYTSAIVVG